MPSLLNFQPLLSTYDPNAGQEDIRQGAREAAGYIARGIEVAGERGRQREKEFQSVFDVDVSKVTDMESKKYIISEYNKLKNGYVNKFTKNKNLLGYGKLSPLEKIELRGDLDSLKSSAETLRILDKSLVEASDPKNKKWGYEIDEKAKNAYSEAKNSGDVSKMASILENVGQSETGIPFVKFEDVNPHQYVNDQVGVIRKAIDSSTEITKKQRESGGKVYDESTTIKKFGTPEDAKVTTYNILSKGEAGAVLEANLQRGSYLSDQEKGVALDEYAGEDPLPLLRYFTENKVDMSPIVEDKIERVSKSVKPVKDSDGRSGKLRVIKKTKAGLEFGSTPIPLTKTIKTVKGKEKLIVGGRVISIKEKNGKSTAQIMVPIESSKELAGYFESMKNLSERKESGEISEEQASVVGSKLMNDYMNIGKWEQVDVPTKDIYQELKTGFDVKKLDVEGFNDMKFTEESTNDWNKYKR